MAKAESNPESITFEQAIIELEDTVKKMEASRLPLEQLIQNYERGTWLLKTCQHHLDAAERRIEIISQGKNEPPRPFNPESPLDAQSASAQRPQKPRQSKPAKKPAVDPIQDQPEEIQLF